LLSKHTGQDSSRTTEDDPLPPRHSGFLSQVVVVEVVGLAEKNAEGVSS